MGKKQQQSQRTKGNLQASSSSRAAQLLQSKNVNITPSLGFCKDGAESAASVDSTLSSSFRKLGKKEAVTKQKALVEILETVSEENIEGCLLLWARNYQKISIDNERKVRELSQQVHSKIVSLAGRNLAPYLGSIMGSWLESTCDINSTTAQIASDALEAAFPGDKLSSAVKFCEKGIVKHVRERLGSSPNTLSDMKVTDPVDAEEKYSRVIGSTLRMIVQILQQTEQCQSIIQLLDESCVWSLGRSKQYQVRRHVYNFISDLCAVPTCTLPAAAHKILAQQLNTCHHETSSVHYAALVTVLISCHQEEFWSTVSQGDLRGQLLDALKSKALNAGVLQSVLLHFAVLVPVIYQHWMKEDLHQKWIEDILSNSSKCLNQCKGIPEKTSLLTFVASISSEIKNKHSFGIPESSLSSIGAMIATLTAATVTPKEDMISPLKIIISNTENYSETRQIVLNNIKQNEFEINNTLCIGWIFVEIGNEDDCVALLAGKCQDKLASGNFEYVVRMMERFSGLSDVLFAKLTEGVSTDVALINLTNGLFIPHFSNSEYTPSKISRLCEVLYHFMHNSNGPCDNLIRTLVQSSQHSFVAFSAFLKIQTGCTTDTVFLPVGLMTEMFDSLDRETCEQFENVVCNLAVLAERIPELGNHLMNFVNTTVSEVDLSDKLVTLLKVIKWSKASDSDLATIELILSRGFTGECLKTLTPVLKNITEQCPDFSEVIMTKITNILDKYPVEVTECMLHVFKNIPEVVISYCVGKLPKLVVDMSLLMDLHKKYAVLNMGQFSEGDMWSESQALLFKTCLEFISSSAGVLGVASVEHLVKFIVYEFTSNGLADMSSKILKSIKIREELCYGVLNELVRKSNMFVIYAVNDLVNHGFKIDWSKIEGLEKMSLESLISLAVAFEDNLLKKLIDQKKDAELTVKERLCYLNFTASKTPNNEEIFEFLTVSCFEAVNIDHQMTARIFSIFLPILFQSSSTAEEDIQFVLNSTAATLQATLDILSDSPTSQEKYHLTASLVSFTELYKTSRDCLKVQKLEKFQGIIEDWDAFYEPGIQDLALVLHDKILSLSSPETASYLSPVILLAPPASVKSFMRSALNKNEGITFDECFDYVMSCYNTLPYETQTSLFYLLLHCQNLFPAKPDNSVVVDEEMAEFASPPVIFLEALSKIDLVNFESEAEYENRLVKSAHIWTLLLISESGQPSDVLREHVEFLRSKQILTEFLDNIVYLIKFSSKKYEIVPMDDIAKCTSFESHQLASSCFMGIAEVFPALLRNWWKKLGKELTISVEKYVCAFVSPTLIKSETNVRMDSDDGTLVIKPRPVVREVVATYTMDDITADLIIFIAPNHPLSPPTVSCERQVGVPVGTWRSWMLQMTSMFQNQNSSIVDALEHWRKNMDRQFEGLESCMICFSVVQGPKKALPKPCCKTCKKKFHSACLYKWFSTSGKSTCPMCRTSFQHATGLRARLQEGPGEEE